MAITKLISPNTPNPIGAGAGGDWEKAMAQLTAVKKMLSGEQMILTQWTNNTTAPALAKGSYFQHMGAIYVIDTEDYALPVLSADGTYYIKLTISGETLVPTYITSLAGFSWSSPHNGLYNASDEQILPYSVIREGSSYGKRKILNLASSPNLLARVDYQGNLYGNAISGASLGVTGNATVGGTLGVTGATTLSGANTLSGATMLNNLLGGVWNPASLQETGFTQIVNDLFKDAYSYSALSTGGQYSRRFFVPQGDYSIPWLVQNTYSGTVGNVYVTIWYRSNGVTTNLRNSFVIAAGSTYSATETFTITDSWGEVYILMYTGSGVVKAKTECSVSCKLFTDSFSELLQQMMLRVPISRIDTSELVYL